MKNKTSARPNKQSKTWQRRLRLTLIWIGAVIGSIIVAIILGLLVRDVVASINSTNLKKELTLQTEEALLDAINESDIKHQEVLDFLLNSTTLVGEPVYSATYNSCYSDHNDSGWFANSYNYRCTLSYVDILEADISDELQARITNQVERFEQTDKNLWDMYQHISILDLAKPSTPITYKDTDGYHNLQAAIPLPINSINIKELATSRAILFNSVVTYATRETDDSKVLLSERDNDEINPEKIYVIVSWDNRYFDRNIGCAFGKIIFCESPLEPVGFMAR